METSERLKEGWSERRIRWKREREGKEREESDREKYMRRNV
jgi:hypothetical protein